MRRNSFHTTVVQLLVNLCVAATAFASPPDWFQRAAKELLPTYPDTIPAVMLRNEQIVNIKTNGEITTVNRCVYKILRAEGRKYGDVTIYFDSETRITSLKAWSIPPTGNSYDLGEKDFAETIPFTDNLYEDTKQKVLRIPASVPGAVIGYEYEQRSRPSILQDAWVFQEDVPVRQARLQINLPVGWEYREVWANHIAVAPKPTSNNQWTWELNELPALAAERGALPMLSRSGQLLLTYIRPGGAGDFKSWSDVGTWYQSLVVDRRQATPELKQKALELTAAAKAAPEKIQALASFVQKEIRYVAIEIGIGGFQPHPAADIFRNRYGDCKDKVTLLSSMLNEIGIGSYYVLINTHRGIIRPEFASPLRFNHAIIAIRVPEDTRNAELRGFVRHPKLGPLVFFDPTHPYVPYGELPVELQDNRGALVGDAGGELITLPLAPPPENSRQRTYQMQLQPDGAINGVAKEVSLGSFASDFRGGWQNLAAAERLKTLKAQFSRRALLVEASDMRTANLDGPGSTELIYQVRIPAYGKAAGNLLLLRPALHDWADDILEHGERTQPIVFPSTMRESETVEIALPDKYAVDELPPPVRIDTAIASYESATEIEGSLLRYKRQLEIKGLTVDTNRLAELKEFYRKVSASEAATAVLKTR